VALGVKPAELTETEALGVIRRLALSETLALSLGLTPAPVEELSLIDGLSLGLTPAPVEELSLMDGVSLWLAPTEKLSLIDGVSLGESEGVT
jgi:hypothetical protein